jgi:hypothetical protein
MGFIIYKTNKINMSIIYITNMELSHVLNYIILALIVAIIIHLLFRAAKSFCNKEGMDSNNINYDNSQKHVHWSPTVENVGDDTKFEENCEGCQYAPLSTPSNIPLTNNIEGMDSVTASLQPEKEVKQENSGDLQNRIQQHQQGQTYTNESHMGELSYTNVSSSCPIDITTKEVDAYVHDFVLGNKSVCKTPKSLEEDQVNSYREKFFGFRNNTWENSHHNDMVDMVNHMYLDGNSDISRNHKGQSIKDIFDNLTNGPNLYTRQCARTIDADNINKVGCYKENGYDGQTYTNDTWVYEEDRAMNGGIVYGSIKANDPNGNHEMAL